MLGMIKGIFDFFTKLPIIHTTYCQLTTAREIIIFARLEGFLPIFCLSILTPKEQPPRKLSGKRIAASNDILESRMMFHSHPRGKRGLHLALKANVANNP